MQRYFLLSLSIFVAFVLEAFFVEYSVGKSDLQTSLERKIEELELAVTQYVTTTTRGVPPRPDSASLSANPNMVEQLNLARLVQSSRASGS